MFDVVPTEISIRILCDAAENDRAAGIALAQTCKPAYSIVTPILFRRVAMTDYNITQVESVLRRADLASFITELAIMMCEGEWNPGQKDFAHLSKLKAIHAPYKIVAIALSGLPPSARSSLGKLWFVTLESPFRRIPSTVSHLCLPPTMYFNEAPMSNIIQQVIETLSVTHLACDFTSSDLYLSNLQPEYLVQSLCEIFEAVGDRIESVSIRFGGTLLEGGRWERFLEALRAGGEDNSRAAHWNHRIFLWRDERYFGDWFDEEMAALDDTLNGVDVWTEARPLVEFL